MKPESQATELKENPLAIFHPNLLIIQSALSLMLGISYALQFPTVPGYLPLSAAIILGISTIIFRTKPLSRILILLVVCFTGITLGSGQLQIPQAPHIRGFVDQPMTLTCSGVITKALASNDERVKLRLALDTIYTPTSLTPTSEPIQNNLFSTRTYGTIQLSMPAFKHDHLFPGDKITVKANLSPPRGFANPGGFNLPFFLHSQNIFISGWVPRPEDIVKHQTANQLSPLQLSLAAEKIRSKLIVFYNSSLPPAHASLYRALITGDRSGLSAQTQEMFKNLGVYHLLAISGLHMGFLAGFVMWISMRIMRQSPRLLLHVPAQQGAAALAMLPVIFYCFISGLHPPAVRACLMTLVLFSAFILRKQWHGPTAIATAAILLLINNPLLLATISFQLSFTAVTAIVFILPLVKKHIFAGQTQPSNLTTLKRTILSGFLISLVASVATLPLLLFHFNRVSLVSPITTLFMEPLLCLWALGFGLAASLCSFILPTLSVVLLKLGSLGFDCSLWVGHMINQLPYLNLWLPSPPVWKILLFYTCLTLLFILRNKKSAFFFSLSLVLLLVPQARNLQFDKVTIIDVGKGNSSLIECASGEKILIDCGGPSGTGFNVGRQIIAPFLYNQQIRTIDLLILSHADLDHYSGATFLLNHFHPKELWIPYIQGDSEQWGIMLETARSLGVIIKIPQGMQSYPLKNSRSLTSISQTHLSQPNWPQNDQSLVIRFVSGSYSFLFPGDIEEQSENRLVHQNTPLRATVMVAPHHGSKSSSTIPFLQKVKPQYTIFSSSLYGRTTFPAPMIVERYTNMGSIPLKTATNGAIIFHIKPNKLKVFPYLQ